MSVESDDESIVLTIGGQTCELSRDAAADLQEAIGSALTEKREFFRTAGEYRQDGSYVVSRRGADSTGNAKVFASFEELRRLYDRLPETFTAEDVGRTGITGSRRHMIIRHLGEHPAFDCRIASRNPLTGEKQSETVESRKEVEIVAD
ncbi:MULTISPECIES: hypothetical protein [Haloferax]|uniref:DUF7528 family protein n=1 Tax=Haloferax TaxID=2251 RepID=UPI001781C7EC|nr:MULTISPECIES: hypothetical protein [Haloferax]